MSMLVLRKLLPYLAIVAVALVIYYSGYRSGVDNTTTKYETRIVEERARLVEANIEALRLAAETERSLLDRLNERDAEIVVLHREAASDPDAQRRALSADSVRRINRTD